MPDPKRAIGDLEVSSIGLGGASWSLIEGRTDEEMIAGIHAAIDAGITLIDTAHAYTTATHPGHSEAMVRRALATHPAGGEVVVTTKGGHFRLGEEFPICGSPTALRSHCEASLALLAVDAIDLYQLHWPDLIYGIPTSVGALAELRAEGLIRHVGLSNVDIAQLEEARAVVPIVSVQNHFSPLEQGDREMIDYCAENGIAYMAYSPLAGGAHGAGRTALADAFPAAAAVAERRGVSVQQLALAWLLALSPTMIPVCGASRPGSIRDSAAAADLELSEEELAELDFESGGGAA